LVLFTLVQWLIPSLSVSKLEKSMLNISGEMEKLANDTAKGLTTLQTEISELSKMTLQNRMALDIILASQGGVCTVLNISCCMYVDHSGELLTDVH
ncbi:ERVV2 protein, partial [Alectura lathami]|nr:ERVV2 protein [Alectura lathami]